MKEIAIFADTTSDLDKATREEYKVDYIPMNFSVDEKDYVASLDWEEFSVKEFYDLMRNGKRVYSSQIDKVKCKEAFLEAVNSGKAVLYISCSSGLSASYAAGQVVAAEIKAENPDAEIYCVDSLISSLGQGYLVMEAAKKRDEGLSAAEIAKYITDIRLRVNQFGTVENLEYLRRAGRVKASQAFFGNLFGVKPIIISDITGHNFAYKKVKGRANSRKAIAEDVKAAANGVYDMLLITHADCEEEALTFRDEILAIAPFKEVKINAIGPGVGASVGPGTLIAFCYGNEVTIEGDE